MWNVTLPWSVGQLVKKVIGKHFSCKQFAPIPMLFSAFTSPFYDFIHQILNPHFSRLSSQHQKHLLEALQPLCATQPQFSSFISFTATFLYLPIDLLRSSILECQLEKPLLPICESGAGVYYWVSLQWHRWRDWIVCWGRNKRVLLFLSLYY